MNKIAEIKKIRIQMCLDVIKLLESPEILKAEAILKKYATPESPVGTE